MTEKRDCKKCGRTVYMLPTLTECPYCGSQQFNEHKTITIKDKNTRSESVKKPIYTDEERLALGLYPKDKGYKMSLISRILGRK